MSIVQRMIKQVLIILRMRALSNLKVLSLIDTLSSRLGDVSERCARTAWKR